MPLKECAYSLQHTGKNDPQFAGTIAKALSDIGSVLKSQHSGSDLQFGPAVAKLLPDCGLAGTHPLPDQLL
jgi:hypothetical protein